MKKQDLETLKQIMTLVQQYDEQAYQAALQKKGDKGSLDVSLINEDAFALYDLDWKFNVDDETVEMILYKRRSQERDRSYTNDPENFDTTGLVISPDMARSLFTLGLMTLDLDLEDASVDDVQEPTSVYSVEYDPKKVINWVDTVIARLESVSKPAVASGVEQPAGPADGP